NYPRAEQHVAVGEHYPLGATGRARGIDERRDLVRPILLDGLRRRLPIERPDAERSQPAEHGNLGVVTLRLLARTVGHLDCIKDAAGTALLTYQIHFPSPHPS